MNTAQNWIFHFYHLQRQEWDYMFCLNFSFWILNLQVTLKRLHISIVSKNVCSGFDGHQSGLRMKKINGTNGPCQTEVHLWVDKWMECLFLILCKGYARTFQKNLPGSLFYPSNPLLRQKCSLPMLHQFPKLQFLDYSYLHIQGEFVRRVSK